MVAKKSVKVRSCGGLQKKDNEDPLFKLYIWKISILYINDSRDLFTLAK